MLHLPRCALVLLALFAPSLTHAQAPGQTVVTADVDRFWNTYDRIQATSDPKQQLQLLKALYIDPGSAGLKAFMEVKGCTAEKYVDLLRKYPRYWASIRPLSLSVKTRTVSLAPELEKFEALYPAMRPAQLYFLVGCMTSGGTTQGDKVLIGTELAMGDESVDVSELPDKTRTWLSGYFRTRPADGLVLLNIHEYVHTQQNGPGPTLLAQVLYEGVADFVAEKITGQTPPLPYMSYGPTHLEAIKARFKMEMDQPSYDGWLYNSAAGSHFGVGDLGYYVGYAIGNAYYQRATDKKEAIRRMIELDYTDAEAARGFLADSGFYP
ncbi:hypothetical protein IP90_02929 [Luteimonas cucumeris]|uniref:Zn-dependent protease DUF2268 n=2 Tax=Luteimonas cucumeris TaxID=985012 RepID=A0A562KX07_9GAMM|nr:hypothetical protein IP90_02929 [Luteimonas cucumeris]